MFSRPSRALCVLLLSCLFVGCFAAEAIDPAKPLPPVEAAQRMKAPEGFRVTLFAGEPDVVQPIAMTTDERGRLWVVECLSYPSWQRHPSRVLKRSKQSE